MTLPYSCSGSTAHSLQAVFSNRPSVARQLGFTMVELLVAMTISLAIVIAAIAALTVSRQGFQSVDASSQLRDNARFAADLMQRVVVQAGFKDPAYALTLPSAADNAKDLDGLIAAHVTGFNNASFRPSDLTTATARTAGAVGYGSDVLIVRYQTAKKNNATAGADQNLSDGSMIDCAGNAIQTIPIDRNERMVSVFHIGVGTDGEPSLMCGYSANGGRYDSQPIIQGVENFQVLYGVDGWTSGWVANTPLTGAQDSVPERYLRADQLVVVGDPSSQATYNNWRRVRSVRIGMVIRGPLNSQLEKVSQTFYPFGLGKPTSTGTPGMAFADNTNDPGTVFTPPTDGRLRQVVTFTIHLRNDQGL